MNKVRFQKKKEMDSLEIKTSLFKEFFFFFLFSHLIFNLLTQKIIDLNSGALLEILSNTICINFLHCIALLSAL